MSHLSSITLPCLTNIPEYSSTVRGWKMFLYPYDELENLTTKATPPEDGVN